MMFAVEVGENLVRLRQDHVSVLQHRNVVLSGHVVNLFAQGANVRNDDAFIVHVEVGQFLAHDVALGTPGDMVEGHRHVDGFNSCRERQLSGMRRYDY